MLIVEEIKVMVHVTVRGFLSIFYTALLNCFAHFYELYHYVTINLSMFLLKVENKSHFCFELLVSQVNHLVSSCCV